ncbi:unnamed protein product [Phytophthora lilii]|uniref:Unnamed protein product n=1 Tax=Phytophthora lilii TaxID=2077276 RepID=A0A9W7DCU6_9STRA|nr:unnamed protein product [Phytophthora lilii]
MNYGSSRVTIAVGLGLSDDFGCKPYPLVTAGEVGGPPSMPSETTLASLTRGLKSSATSLASSSVITGSETGLAKNLTIHGLTTDADARPRS